MSVTEHHKQMRLQSLLAHLTHEYKDNAEIVAAADTENASQELLAVVEKAAAKTRAAWKVISTLTVHSQSGNLIGYDEIISELRALAAQYEVAGNNEPEEYQRVVTDSINRLIL
jgi:ethanolamine ammonia-lyase large subunit